MIDLRLVYVCVSGAGINMRINKYLIFTNFFINNKKKVRKTLKNTEEIVSDQIGIFSMMDRMPKRENWNEW